MSEASKIEWCDHTFNPWWGCARVSPGCQNCYAETFAHRLGLDVWGKNSERRFFGDRHWAEPRRWDRKAAKEGVRRRVFCASMADVFDDRRDLDGERGRLWTLIEETPHLDWLLLTKRPENVHELVADLWQRGGWPPNVWLGVSVEDQQRADERVPALLSIPAAVRFLSCEPLLGPVDLSDWLDDDMACENGADRGIDWLIAGGESGHGARPMHPEWARSLRDQCTAAGVPFFFKQWGTWCHPSQLPPDVEGSGSFLDDLLQVGKHAAGRVLDGRTWDEMPAAAA